MNPKALLMTNGAVFIIDSYIKSRVSGEICGYTCLPSGLTDKHEMFENDSFIEILKFSPDIVLEYGSIYLHNLVKEIKAWGEVKDNISIDSSMIYHFINEDYQLNSNLIEAIIYTIYKISVWIGYDEIDDAPVFSISFK